MAKLPAGPSGGINERLHHFSIYGAGTKSASNLRNLTRRNSQSIETAARMSLEQERQGIQESLNVVVETYPSPKQEQAPSEVQTMRATQSRQMIGSPTAAAELSAAKLDLLTDRVHTQVLPSQTDALSPPNMHYSSKARAPRGGAEVLASSSKMGQELSAFAATYDRKPSPILDNPTKQAYLLGQAH